jgi:hypothetical protein
MTALIDTIQDAFVAEREQADYAGGELSCGLVVEAIERYLKIDDERLEGAVARAYIEARAAWGNEWIYASGDVAERILVHVRLVTLSL